MDEQRDIEHMEELQDHSLKLLKVLDRVYEQDSQFIITVLGTALCTLGVGMYGTEKFKHLLDQIHIQVDEMFETSEVQPDTEMTQLQDDTIMSQDAHDKKR